jgi:hypothetical protein
MGTVIISLEYYCVTMEAEVFTGTSCPATMASGLFRATETTEHCWRVLLFHNDLDNEATIIFLK